MNPRIVSALAIAGLTIPTVSVAALGPIVVTASRTEEPKRETLAPVTVLNSSDIENSNAESLQGVLREVPGVQITQKGGYGSDASIHLRGTNDSHVLVLVDGVRHNSSTLGGADFQYLPLDLIERIEVVRGPRSSLYGSDAIGGVIQIFTRRGKDKTQYHAEVGAGSNDSRKVNAGLSGKHGQTRYSLSGGRFRTRGIDARRDKNPDADSYYNANGSLNIDHRITKKASAGLSVMHAEGANEYDGRTAASDYETDFLQQTVSGNLDLTVMPIWDLKVQAGQSRDESTEFVDDVKDSFFHTERQQASVTNEFFLGDRHELIVGADYQDDRVDSSTDYDETSRINTSFFGQWRVQFDQQLLRIGLRQDDNEFFGTHTTGNIDWGLDLTPRLRLIASYGTAFKSPTLNDLFYSSIWGQGDPSLKPEKSESYEIGLEGKQLRTTWSVRAYQTEIEDLIEWEETSPYFYEPRNIGTARIQGLELTAARQWGPWYLKGNVSLLDPVNAETDQQLARRAKRTVSVDIQRQWKKWELGATIYATSARYDDADNEERLSGYGLLDMRATYKSTPAWTVQGKLSNALDKDYETAKGYNTLGRRFMLTVRYSGER